MSWGRGRRDLDGLAGDLSREDQHRLASAQARLEPRPSSTDDDDGFRRPRPNRSSAIFGRIKRALGRG
jgi:hypothetical protein